MQKKVPHVYYEPITTSFWLMVKDVVPTPFDQEGNLHRETTGQTEGEERERKRERERDAKTPSNSLIAHNIA